MKHIYHVFMKSPCTRITAMQFLTSERFQTFRMIEQSTVISSCPTIQLIISPKLIKYITFNILENIKIPISVYYDKKSDCMTPICCKQTIDQLIDAIKKQKS